MKKKGDFLFGMENRRIIIPGAIIFGIILRSTNLWDNPFGWDLIYLENA
jgi:hypothetical protein